MLDTLLLPLVLALLAYLCLDKEVRTILTMWSVVYWIDLFIGGLFFATYPLYFVFSIITCIVLTTYTIQMMSYQWEKALVLVGLAYVDIFLSGYELIVRWPDWFYPYISTINWWLIEVQLIVLIYNVKFKIINR